MTTPSDSPDSHPSAESSPPAEGASAPVRLQRFLAQCGLGARRECEPLVTSGRITIDGKRVTELGTKVDPRTQDVRLDGEKLKPQQRQTFVFNKPPGVLCTMRDPKGRPRVVDFFPAAGPRLFTVGRLDENSTGLLIVTNDGDLAQKLAHPKYRIYRTYHIHVKGIPGRDALTAVKQGLWFEEGKFRVQSAKILKRHGKSTIMEVVLREGQNREVRRLFDRVGHKVMKLKRIAFGPIRLGNLSMGKHRPISKDELSAIRGILERNKREQGKEQSEEDTSPPPGRRGKRPRRPPVQSERNRSQGRSERRDSKKGERPAGPRRPGGERGDKSPSSRTRSGGKGRPRGRGRSQDKR